MSEKDKHPLKLISIFIVWILALYTSILIMRQFSEEPPESPKFPSRPPVLPVKHRGVCKSPECITLAHQLHNWRDISVDPCQDFYKAACGKYNEHSLVKGGLFLKTSGIVRELVKEFLRKKPSSTSRSENAMGVFFEKCEEARRMNKRQMDLANNLVILMLMKKVGSWPMLDENWNGSNFDLNDVFSSFARIAVDDFGFFNIKSGSAKIGIDVDIANLTVQSVEKEILSFMDVNGIKTNRSFIRQDVEEVVGLTDKLSLLASIGNTSTIESMIRNGIDELQKNVPSVDFERILKSRMNEKRKDVIWEKVKNQIITFPTHPYFADRNGSLEAILTSTPKRTLANFLFFNLLSNLKKRSGSIAELNLQEDSYCAQLIMVMFPLPTLRIYVRNHYDKENLQEASEMVEELKEGLIEMFLDSTWLSERTKMRAIRKANSMKKVIGYPKEFDVPGGLDSFYESLNLLNTDTFLSILLKAYTFRNEQFFDHLAGFFPLPYDHEYAFAGAQYHPGLNELTLKIAFLDDPIFDSTYPKYAKIATIGEIIGHEMGHGFDAGGRKIDENGVLNDWWTPEDSKEYERRTQCFIDHFNSYDDPDYGRELNGTTTIKEHAADIIGVHLSLKAYNKVDFANEPSIFGFEDEKPDKLFFHLTALNWCESKPNSQLASQLTAVHPTSSFRVNGIFSNMKEFSEAFNCPVGSPMNPEKKCELF